MSFKHRLLLNAEPFGFGPAAAIASIFPHLQSHQIELAYIGEKHTLDLQKKLPYEAVYDTTNTSQAARIELLSSLADKYDTFVTAMDFSMAEHAQKVGINTIIYDALTWYWPVLHPSIAQANLYIAQDFFGVRERLAATSKVTNYKVVPPIVTMPRTPTKKEHVLLNLGGLQNPFWNFEDTVLYAQILLRAVKNAIPPDETLIVTTSTAVAKALRDPTIQTLERERMLNVLGHAKYAIMTPGLGNIYDAAAFNVPTLWLPPANDSQGQQAQLLVQYKYCDEYVDWGELGKPIKYEAHQTKVLQDITSSLCALSNSALLQASLAEVTAKKLSTLSQSQNSKTAKLLQKFGTDGAATIAVLIKQHLESKVYAPV